MTKIDAKIEGIEPFEGFLRWVHATRLFVERKLAKWTLMEGEGLRPGEGGDQAKEFTQPLIAALAAAATPPCPRWCTHAAARARLAPDPPPTAPPQVVCSKN